jgi:PAS domain S-box-containing protein
MKESNKTREELLADVRYLKSRLQKPSNADIDEALYSNKQTVKAVLNTLQDSALIIDKDGIIISFNEIAQQVLCKNFAVPKGKNIFSFFPKHAHSFLKLKGDEVIQTGMPVNFEEERDQKIFNISIYPIFDKQRVNQLVVFARDITERKRIEESEYRKSLQLEQLLETSRHLTSSLDLTEVLTRICVEAKEILRSYGCTVYILEETGTILQPKVSVDPIYQEEILSTPIFVEQSFTGRTVKQKKAIIFNDTSPHSGGYQIPGTSVLENERIIAAPFIINDEVIGALCLNRIGSMFTQEDLAIAETFASFAGIALKNAQSHEELSKEIISRKNAENELESHREHLKLINRILRHDLMNYLAVLKSSLRIYFVSKEEKILKDALEIIDKSVDLINRMRELELFSAIHKNLKIFEVRKILQQIQLNMGDFTIEIEGNCSVLADDSLISVFENIVRNAKIHSQSNSLKIKIDKRTSFCHIHFIDNGIGIPDEIKDKIFEESFSFGKTGNTGLGLYIVKKAVESYGGYVTIQNAIPHGAEFVVGLKIIN